MSGAFGKLADRLRTLAECPSAVAQKTAESVEKLISDEFSSGNDPYGRPWKALAKGGNSTLQESGALKGSLKVTAEGTSVEIAFSDYKFAFHQATRPILSIGVMPTTWSQAIEEAFSSTMKK